MYWRHGRPVPAAGGLRGAGKEAMSHHRITVLLWLLGATTTILYCTTAVSGQPQKLFFFLIKETYKCEKKRVFQPEKRGGILATTLHKKAVTFLSEKLWTQLISKDVFLSLFE